MPLKMRAMVILFGCIFLLTGFDFASGAEIFDNVTETRLDNGLKIILMENHIAPVVTFQVWYHAGSRKDSWGNSGLAHVFEHMMFKGTKKFSGDEFSRLIRSRGGNFNAFTSYDFAGYFENLTAGQVEIAIELEADRMQNLVLRPEEFRTEVQVVMEERRMRVEDDPKAYLGEQTRATAFQAQPYHWPIIGWMDDLKRINIEDIRHHYEILYRPSNAFIVAVGDFETKRMIEKVRKWFAPITAREQPPLIEYHDPPQRGERRVNVHAHAELPYIMIGYHVPNIENQDAYGLEVIAAILSAGKSSRLYRNLVLEKELAISADARNSLLSVDPDLFYLTAESLPGVSPDQIEAALEKELDRLKTEPIASEELQKAKNQLETSFVYSQDSVFHQGMILARYEIVSKWQDVRKYIPSIRKVTAEDIREAARTYFKKRNRTVGILYPLEDEKEQPPERNATGTESEKGAE